MTKFKSQKTVNHTKITFFAGATTLMALTYQANADSGVDALLNKLEQKGILSVDEAKQLRAENDKSSSEDFNKAFNSKIQMPDWVSSYKLYGDFRGRFDDVSTETPFNANSSNPAGTPDKNNQRWRYRLRAGLTINMQDDMQVGFRLASADNGKGADSGSGNPLSNTSTLQGNGSKKSVWIDAAYGKWTPINDGTWMLAGIIGKMDLPFQASPMVFDSDYTPEGAALQSSYKINDHHSLAANGGIFVIDQLNSRGPYLYGGQAIWNANWTKRVATSAGVGAYNIANEQSIPASFTGTPYDSNLGNSLNPATGQPLYHYNPVVASGSATYTLDKFPLYPGAFPIKVAGEYMNNPAAPTANEGWWVGVTFGKLAKKHTWDISYRYQQLEADAWWDQIVDDDNVALFPSIPVVLPTETGSIAGGTNIKGSLVKFDYVILDSLTFSFTCYINELISNPVLPHEKTDTFHAMADLMLKF